MTVSEIQFSSEQLAEVRRLQSLYPDRRGALLPVLHMAQETFGHISLDVEAYVATLFEMSPAHVHEVVTFYTLFFQQPKGRHVLAICHNLSCHLAGAQDILAHVKSRSLPKCSQTNVAVLGQTRTQRTF